MKENFSSHAFSSRAKEIAGFLLIFSGMLLIIFAFRSSVFDIRKVDGMSMYPTYQDGQLVIIQKYHLDDIHRYDVVLCESAEGTLIKRVIGMPGDVVKMNTKGQVFVNNKPIDDKYQLQVGLTEFVAGEWVCKENEYFVLGDNRSNSKDSRYFGPFPRALISGISRN